MKKIQLWLNFGILAGLIWPRLSYYGQLLNGVSKELFLFYDNAVNELGLPFGNALVVLATDPITYLIGNHIIDADKTVLFIFSLVLTLLISIILLLWLIIDVVYWILNLHKPYKAKGFIKKFNIFCYIIFILYCVEWIVAAILSNVLIVPMFGAPSFGVYMLFLVGTIKVVFYNKKELFE